MARRDDEERRLRPRFGQSLRSFQKDIAEQRELQNLVTPPATELSPIAQAIAAFAPQQSAEQAPAQLPDIAASIAQMAEGLPITGPQSTGEPAQIPASQPTPEQAPTRTEAPSRPSQTAQPSGSPQAEESESILPLLVALAGAGGNLAGALTGTSPNAGESLIRLSGQLGAKEDKKREKRDRIKRGKALFKETSPFLKGSAKVQAQAAGNRGDIDRLDQIIASERRNEVIASRDAAKRNLSKLDKAQAEDSKTAAFRFFAQNPDLLGPGETVNTAINKAGQLGFKLNQQQAEAIVANAPKQTGLMGFFETDERENIRTFQFKLGIKRVMKANGISREEAVQALKQAGKLPEDFE